MVGPSFDRLAEEVVGGEARLVLPHVGEQRATVDVADRVEPCVGHTCGTQLFVHLNRCAGLEPDGVETEILGVRTATDGHEQLVGHDLAPVGEHADDGAVFGLAAGRGKADARLDRDPIAFEAMPHVVAGKRLFVREEPVRQFDDGDFLRAEAPPGLTRARRRSRLRPARAGGGARPSPQSRRGCPRFGCRVARGSAGSTRSCPVATTTARRACRRRTPDDEWTSTSTTRSPANRPWPRTSSTPTSFSHCACESSIHSPVIQSRRASAAAASMGPVTASRAPGTRDAAARMSPGRMSVLLGMQPQYEHSPPTSSTSTSATCSPPDAARPATFSPAGPPPMTTTSQLSTVSPRFVTMVLPSDGATDTGMADAHPVA